MGPKALEEDKIEVRARRTVEVKEFAAADYLPGVQALLADL